MEDHHINSLSLSGQKKNIRNKQKKGALIARTVIQQTSTILATQAQNLGHLMSHISIKKSDKRNSKCALSFSLTLCEHPTSHDFGKQQQSLKQKNISKHFALSSSSANKSRHSHSSVARTSGVSEVNHLISPPCSV